MQSKLRQENEKLATKKDESMRAEVVKDAINITIAVKLEGKLVLETECKDFNSYCALPAAVSFEGVVCAKTGWSSDRGYACYKEGGLLAYNAIGKQVRK